MYMKLYIQMKTVIDLPNRDELQKIMWENAKNISYALDLKEFRCLSLKWDNWLDDVRFSSNTEYRFIDFELIENNLIELEIADKALFVDKRAFYNGAYLIADKTQGTLSKDNRNWIDKAQFKLKKKEFFETTFYEAVERSLL